MSAIAMRMRCLCPPEKLVWIVAVAWRRVGNADLFERSDGPPLRLAPGAARRVGLQALRHLPADGHHGIQRRHGLLKDHGNLESAHGLHGARGLGQQLDHPGVSGSPAEASRHLRRRAEQPH